MIIELEQDTDTALSRRQFVKGGVAAGVLAGVGGLLAGCTAGATNEATEKSVTDAATQGGGTGASGAAGTSGAAGAADPMSATQTNLPTLPGCQPNPQDQFGIDININMTTIDNWLDRPDVACFDMRMLFDPADYAAVGGDADLSRTIRGFRIVPYPYLASLQELPVSGAYAGNKLFTLAWDEAGRIISATPNYQESLQILEDTFPRDKAIFVMCGAGGYASMTKALLEYLGWDGNRIYNIGGNWSYDGPNALELIHYPDTPDGHPTYATWRANYALIDFTRLHPVE
ncbi:MAG: hypothetical protein LBR39_00620 [Coriobacteriales bacterium]|jgi:hypothetical protein|nr:hypothetical protein [Coriobacteriales bacterium]